MDYKKRMLSKFVEVYDDRIDQLEQLASQAKKGRKGLNVGCPAHILDAGIIIKQCWENLAPSSILGCWRHAKCLSHLPSPESNESRPTVSKEQLYTIQDLCSKLCNLSINPEAVSRLNEIGLSDLVSGGEEISEAVSRWMNLEDDPEVIASDDLMLVDEVENSLLQSLNDSHADGMESFENFSVDIVEIESEAESEVRLNLLKYATEAIDIQISDPVLLELANKIRSHILQI